MYLLCFKLETLKKRNKNLLESKLLVGSLFIDTAKNDGRAKDEKR
jgi:hypothetical protein